MAQSGNVDVLELDLRGQVCPATLLKSLSEINRRKEDLQSGALRMDILTDHREATVTVPEMAGSMGYEVTVAKGDGHYVIRVGAPRA